MSEGYGSEDRGLPLESALALVAAAVRQVVAEEIVALRASQASTGPSNEDEWASKPAASKRFGVSVATLSRLQRSGELTRGRNGRVNVAEAKLFFARAAEKATPAVPLTVLKHEKIKRAAAEIRALVDLAGGRDGR